MQPIAIRGVRQLVSPRLVGRLAMGQQRRGVGDIPPPDVDPTRGMAKLLDANKQWAKETQEKDPEFFKQLAQGQAPKYLWIGCSDSRVPANTLTGLGPGDVFVHRNVANLVVNTDMNLMSVLQYAVDALDVEHIMVVGHYECGGIKAAMSNHNHGSPLENWVRNIRDVMRLRQKELLKYEDFESRFRRLVELNVIEQCLNIMKTHTVQRRRVETYRAKKRGQVQMTYPRVHGLVYDPRDGILTKLNVEDEARQDILELRQIYDVYRPGQTTMDMP